MNRCCPNAVKESRSERVGLYRNEQGGFACLALLKITLGLHQCQRSNRRNVVYWEGTNTGNRGKHNQCNATIWCMNVTWQYAVDWPNATSNKLNGVGLNTRFKFKLHMCFIKCHLFVFSKTGDKHCSNMHENAIFRFLGFFWSFFIYNLFHLELRLILYDF